MRVCNQDAEGSRVAKRAVLQVPGADEAVSAFALKFPKVVAKPRPDYLGTPCSEDQLRERYQALGALVGRDEALPLVREEPLLLAMEAYNLRASWEALLEVAKGDRVAALRVVQRHPNCLVASSREFQGKSLDQFESMADLMQTFRPVGKKLQDIGPEGFAVGAAAFGVAALGALAAKLQADSKTSGSVESKRGRPMQGRDMTGQRGVDLSRGSS